MKRLLDILVSMTVLVLLSPLIALVAIAVRLNIGSPILFRQTRPGYLGEPFEILKFRTMTNEKGPDGKLLPDADRLPKFGKLLRSSSLDELPELLNVLKGNMSLVGPRPLLMEYLPLYDAEQVKRHDVLPGITGWAQVNGRNALSWDDKFMLDTWYVDNQSLWLDLKILFLTFKVVLRRDGIAADEHVTMPHFKGNGRSLDPET